MISNAETLTKMEMEMNKELKAKTNRKLEMGTRKD